MIQSILFPKNLYTLQSAKKWLRNHKKKILKVDETDHFYRFRQRNPRSGDRYYTKKIDGGIELIIKL